MSTLTFFPSVAKGWDRLYSGPLSDHIDDFAEWLSDQRYAPPTGRKKLRLAGHLSRWMLERGHCLPDLDEALLEAFLVSAPYGGSEVPAAAGMGRQLLQWLRETGRLVPPDPGPVREDPVACAVNRYEAFLRDERGLRPNTITAYLSTVRLFLEDCGTDRAAGLESLCLNDIHGFLLRSCQHQSPATTRLKGAALRSFTGHLFQSGTITTDLTGGIVKVRTWRLSSLPKALDTCQVQAVLASCDRETAIGRRDYAILLMLAQLGLRACEVSALMLDDIDWSRAVVGVSGKGGRRDDLPLPHAVGDALVAYLRDGRPQACSTRHLFVRRYAPLHGLGASTITVIVRQAFVRAGISRPGRGAAHLFRHALASTMLRNGASLEEIGQVLRHWSLDSTRIYAKVDLDALSPLAPAWPGGAS